MKTPNRSFKVDFVVYVNFYHVLFPGTVEPVGVKNNSDGTYTVHYTPAQDGPYTVAVKYADQEVPHRYSMICLN